MMKEISFLAGILYGLMAEFAILWLAIITGDVYAIGFIVASIALAYLCQVVEHMRWAGWQDPLAQPATITLWTLSAGCWLVAAIRALVNFA